jgi:FkbM family methyltransferase
MEFEIEHDGRRIRLETYSAEDAIARRMRKYRAFYERDLLEYSRALLADAENQQGLVVDVGANFGNHSVFWGAFTGRHVVAVEANPALIPILSRNLRRNIDETRSTVIAGGAGAVAGEGRLRLAAHAPGQFGLARVERVVKGDAESFEIQPLDVWLDRSGLGGRGVSLLKIDVEGAEVDVLQGAAGILRRDRPEIIAEAATGAEREAIETALAPFGYRRIKRFCSTPTWHLSTRTERSRILRLHCVGTAARLRWRYARLRHSVASRLRPAA